MPMKETRKAELIEQYQRCPCRYRQENTDQTTTSGRQYIKQCAFEYWLTCHMLTMIKARQAAAKKAAIDAGVIFDSERDPRPPGTKRREYIRGDQVAIWLTVKNGGVSYDGKADVSVSC
jgi:hypothetical protein